MTRRSTIARTPTRLLPSLVMLAAGVVSAPAFAQVVPAGPELVVSTSTTKQRQPAVAAKKDGFLVAWEDTTLGVYGRNYLAAGTPQGAAVRLVASDPLPPTIPWSARLKEMGEPAVAARQSDSTFLLVWNERLVERTVDFFSENRTVISTRLRARRFAANGTPLAGAAGAILEVAPTIGFPTLPSAVATADGSVWIVWSETGARRGGIHLRRVDPKGKLGADIRVAATVATNPTAESLTFPAIAVGGDGLLVAWEQCCQAGAVPTVFARLFKPTGVAAGAAFKVPTVVGQEARAPAVAGRLAKDFMIVWESSALTGNTLPSIHGQLITKAGVRLGAEKVLAAHAEAAYLLPEVAATTDRNGWLVLWNTYDLGVRRFVDGRNFSAVGAPVGAVTHFSSSVPNRLWMELAVAVHPTGRALVTWVGDDATSGAGIRGRGARGPVRTR
jgi:hypothetical protein